MRSRLFAYAALICLPVVLAIGAGAYYIFSNVPQWIRRESGRITREYRETAELLLKKPDLATYVGEHKKEWRSLKRIEGLQWGYNERGERALVWLRISPDITRAKEVDVVSPVPYALIFYFGGGAIALILILLTSVAVWSLCKFMREREDFLAATAHDLTTPLVGLRLCIGRSDDDAKALVERLLIIVSNIKDFLKLGGRRAPNITNVDLLASVREAYTVFAADFRDLFDGNDVEIISLGAVYARADSVMLMQILWNLFGNDLKYAAPYGKVTVKIRRQGAFAFVDFIDNGQGMTKHEMKCAFDRYYRASTVLKSGKGGFGIGLCTAREFARAMGGELSVSSNFPRGCVFTLRLPSVIVKRCS